MGDIKVWIDDREVMVQEGQTILQAADAVGVYVPRLCYHPVLEPSGSCRLCAVEIEGYRGLPASCTTPVEDGMRIQTKTQRVTDFRKEMFRLILQEHPRECLGCFRNGSCELQQLVAAVGIDFPYAPHVTNRSSTLLRNSYFERDYSLCIRCGRCVRVCHEIRGAKAIAFREVAGRCEVRTPLDRPLETVGCQFCGACVDVCPVGALRDNLEAFYRKPIEHIQTICERLTAIVTDLYKKELKTLWKVGICPICSAGCRLLYELSGDGEIIRVKPDQKGPSNRGQACVQGRFLIKKYLSHPDRAEGPFVKKEAVLEDVTWDEALERAVEGFKRYDPKEIAILTDGRATNEELYALKRFAEEVLKTPVKGLVDYVDDGESSSVIQKEMGIVSCTNSYDDIPEAGVILAIGFNPAATHPIAGVRIREAVLKGSKLVVANPYAIAIARYSHIHLRYVPGTELVLICGLIRVILDNEGAHESFAAKYDEELSNLRKSLEPYNLETVSQITGIHEELLMEAGRIIATHNPLAVLYGLGLTRVHNAAECTRALVALTRIKGSIGKPGGGIAPLYGTGNIQGARNLGFDTGVLRQLKEGKIKAIYLTTESYEPDLPNRLAPFLSELEFVVAQDVVRPYDGMKVDVFLPLASIMEKEGSLTNSERRVQWTEVVVNPPGEARALLWTITALARRMGVASFLPDSTEAVFSEMCYSVNGYQGISLSLAKFEPVQWPCPTKGHPGSPVLLEGEDSALNGWRAPVLSELPSESVVDSDFPFRVVTKESLCPSFVGPLLAPEALNVAVFDAEIEMNPADAYLLGYQAGDTVVVHFREGQVDGRLALNIYLPPGLVAILRSMIENVMEGAVLRSRIIAAKVEKK